MKTTARLWIALTRPDNLLSALAVAAAGREYFGSCCLLYENSAWWKAADWNEYQGAFDAIHSVERVEAIRRPRDLRRYYRALQERQRQLFALGIAPHDLIVTLAGITKLSNALASAYPEVNKVLCITVKKYVDASRPVSFIKYRHTTSGWLQNRVVEPKVGLHRTLNLKPWRGGGDGVRLIRLEEPLENVFEAIVLLSNRGDELPGSVGENVSAAPFPSIGHLNISAQVAESCEHLSRQKVVFFGTPFLLVRNLPPAACVDGLNRCLDYLRLHYAPERELVYRPHPAETSERQQLRLDGFTVEDDRQVAELYFLRHHERLAAVYSVSSTVSRVALNYGMNGYALWRNFPFDPAARAYFESLMGSVPPEFEPRSLDKPPVSYANPSCPRSSGFGEAIRRVMLRLQGAASPRQAAREKAVAAPLDSPV